MKSCWNFGRIGPTLFYCPNYASTVNSWEAILRVLILSNSKCSLNQMPTKSKPENVTSCFLSAREEAHPSPAEFLRQPRFSCSPPTPPHPPNAWPRVDSKLSHSAAGRYLTRREFTSTHPCANLEFATILVLLWWTQNSWRKSVKIKTGASIFSNTDLRISEHGKPTFLPVFQHGQR